MLPDVCGSMALPVCPCLPFGERPSCLLPGSVFTGAVALAVVASGLLLLPSLQRRPTSPAHRGLPYTSDGVRRRRSTRATTGRTSSASRATSGRPHRRRPARTRRRCTADGERARHGRDRERRVATRPAASSSCRQASRSRCRAAARPTPYVAVPPRPHRPAGHRRSPSTPGPRQRRDNPARRSRSSTASAPPARHQPAGGYVADAHDVRASRPRSTPVSAPLPAAPTATATSTSDVLTTNATAPTTHRHRQHRDHARPASRPPLAADRRGDKTGVVGVADHRLHAGRDRRHRAVHLERDRPARRRDGQRRGRGLRHADRRPGVYDVTATVTDAERDPGDRRRRLHVHGHRGADAHADRRDPGHRRALAVRPGHRHGRR